MIVIALVLVTAWVRLLNELSPEAFDLSMGVNARATWLLGKAAHPLAP
jgi:hypothetical protein